MNWCMHVHVHINFQNNNKKFIYIFRHILKIYAFTPSAQNILSIKHCHNVFINQLSSINQYIHHNHRHHYHHHHHRITIYRFFLLNILHYLYSLSNLLLSLQSLSSGRLYFPRAHCAWRKHPQREGSGSLWL